MHQPFFKAMTTSLDIEAALPCLFSNCEIANKMRKSTHIVAIESAEKFAPAFAKSELRNTVGRACHTLYDESSWERCFDMMASLIPNMLVNTLAATTTTKANPLRTACIPSHTGLAKSSVSCGPEAELLPSLRVTLVATRFVVIFSYAEMVKFLITAAKGSEARVSNPAAITSEYLQHFLNEISKDDADAMAAMIPNLYWATVAPGDVVYTPAGFYTWEKVHFLIITFANKSLIFQT